MNQENPTPSWPAWSIKGGPIGQNVRVYYNGQLVTDILSVQLNVNATDVVTALIEVDGFELDLEFDRPTYTVRETDALPAVESAE